MVWGEMWSTIPSCWSWRARSVQSHGLSERPTASGRSHAKRTTCKPTSGGKGPRPAGPWAIRQPVHAFGTEPIQPPAHPLMVHPHVAGDLTERQPIGGQQHNPGAPGETGGHGGAAGEVGEGGADCRRQLDHPWTAETRHGDPPLVDALAAPSTRTSSQYRTNGGRI